MQTNLPLWATTDEARALIEALLIERPDFWWLKRFADDNNYYPKFKGFTARALRQLWEKAREAAMDAGDRDLWCQLGRENPDDLLERLFAEEQLTETHGDPLLKRRAA